MVYLITYDLNRPGKDYSVLYRALQRFQYIRDPGLDSVWFVSTSWNAAQVYNFLAPNMDRSDRVIVTQMRVGEHNGWMNQAVWTWINQRI